MASLNRADVIDENVRSFLQQREPEQSEPFLHSAPLEEADISKEEARDILISMIYSRQMDFVGREMKNRGTGFYGIHSAGHEGNAVISRELRTTDPAIVHYRSGGFMIHRLFRDRGERPLKDLILSLAASSADPVAGGRHKIWGDTKTFVPPQTSTIASQMPRVVGMAFALERMQRLNVEPPVPEDAIMISSFGDATVNHSVFQGALNAALWTAHQHLPLPLLLICEDNGRGISVPTPKGWIESSIKNREGIHYFQCDGRDFVDLARTTRKAAETCRNDRQPVFLHMETIRLMGHASSDIELEYRNLNEVRETEQEDPLLHFADFAVKNDLWSSDELLDIYDSAGRELRNIADDMDDAPRHDSAEEVMEPIAYPEPGTVREEASRTDYYEKRLDMFGSESDLPEHENRPRDLATLLNSGLADLLAKYDEMTIFGEDVADKGGVYYVTRNLKEKADPARVFDTLLDENTILGLGLGMGILGTLPFPEIQYLAYLYNAYDQIRGEATAQSFFSDGQFKNGMVVRVQSFGYQEGFGGHYHNDNGIAALREVPGLIIACPSRGDDAVRMLRTCAALAREEGHVVLFLEPIALYHTKHLFPDREDGAWQFSYPPPDECIPFREPRTEQVGNDSPRASIVSFANGFYRSIRVARQLEKERGITTRIIDLRWLHPLPKDVLDREAKKTGRILVVDECRETGGPSEAIMTHYQKEHGEDIRVRRLASRDSFVPLGPSTEHIMVSESDIRSSLLKLLEIEE